MKPHLALDDTQHTLHHVTMEAKISTTVYMSREQHNALKRLSEATRVPVAVYIRDGIAMVLAAHAKKTKTMEAGRHE